MKNPIDLSQIRRSTCQWRKNREFMKKGGVMESCRRCFYLRQQWQICNKGNFMNVNNPALCRPSSTTQFQCFKRLCIFRNTGIPSERRLHPAGGLATRPGKLVLQHNAKIRSLSRCKRLTLSNTNTAGLCGAFLKQVKAVTPPRQAGPKRIVLIRHLTPRKKKNPVCLTRIMLEKQKQGWNQRQHVSNIMVD